MDLRSIGSSLTKQSQAKGELQEPHANAAKKAKKTGHSTEKMDKVFLSAKGVEQSTKSLKLVEQLHKLTQADLGTAALALGNLDLDKATALLQ